MNQVMIAMGKAPEIRLLPLDPALNQSSLTKESIAAFGLRVARVLNRRLEVEGSVDYKRKGLVIRPESLAAIEATRSSFITAWSNAGLPNASVTSTSTIRNEESRELLSTGSLILNLKPERRLVPFASGGLGVITQTSGPPSAELRGAYPFGVGPFQINESDTVSIGYDVPHHTVVGLLGGGVKYRLSDRWGLRGDGRVILGSNKGDTVIDTRSTVTTNAASGFTIVSSTNPAFQFSSDQSVRSSSLSGSPLSRFRTFTSEGTQTEFGLSGGIFFRF
jgi:hypothetical protein